MSNWSDQEIAAAREALEETELPSRPQGLLEAFKAQSAFAPDLAVAADAIGRDMALSAAVLRAANHNLSGYQGKIASVREAVMLLGFGGLRELVAEQFLDAPLAVMGSPAHEIRLRAQICARVCELLAALLPQRAGAMLSGHLPSVAPDVAHTLGLLHDAGAMLMTRRFRDYAALCDEHVHSDGAELLAAERSRYGFDHTLAGWLAWRDWGLPKALCRAVAAHHDGVRFLRPDQPASERTVAALQGILSLALRLAGQTSDAQWREQGPALLVALHLTPSEWSVLNDQIARAGALDPAEVE
ncbi:HDOD domain-containing protein [Magnetofaba australis]|uniref:Putative HDOD domain-containing protein n=1 Tax=Magnetofaba australis IT-1 TaxID=1434232 RepID=A0A1Y2K546_9PROT|nr:HDOD domain-containing protein [Magnetofaba australis]OSM04379.1 putative HDOD domain-containing protein [Magnetofaba australis IT-1]